MHVNGKNTVKIALVVLLVGVGGAASVNCNSSSGSGGATTSTATGTGTTSAVTSTTTTSTKAATSATGTTAAATTTTATGGGDTLTVMNYLSWCSVGVNGAAANINATQTVMVASGTAVPLTATGAPGFVLSGTMWHHVDDDTGAGAPGTVTGGTTSAEKVTVSGAKCVWVCCPGTAGVPACPTTDQCPAGG